jgi:hypothetical protein
MRFEGQAYLGKAFDEDRRNDYSRTQPAKQRQLHRVDIFMYEATDDKVSGPKQYTEY